MTTDTPREGSSAVVATAGDAIEAEIWVAALRDAGIEAATFERGPGAALGGATVPWASYTVIVPASRLAAARNVLAELAGASVLAPYRAPSDVRDQRQIILKFALGIVIAAILLALVLRFAL